MTEKTTGAESAPEPERLAVTVDLENMTIGDYLALVDPAGPREQFTTLDKYVTVEGWDSVLHLPLADLQELVDAVRVIISEAGDPGGN